MNINCNFKKNFIVLIFMSASGCVKQFTVDDKKTITNMNVKIDLSDDELKIKNVFDKYGEVIDQNPLSVPEKERTLMIIYTFHPIIGNGGFRWLFENDLPGSLTYRDIIDSYKKIDLQDHANYIEKVLALFPESTPHKNLEKRRSFLDKYFDTESSHALALVDEAESFFYTDYSSVIKKVEQYYLNHRK